MRDVSSEHTKAPPDPGASELLSPVEHALRWEWRSFEYKPRLWQDAIQDAVKSMPVGLMAETYLLARTSPNHVKVRDGRLEVKQLLSTDERGLELWRPILEAGFPLRREALGALVAFWGLPRRDECDDVESPEELLSFVTRCAPAVRIVPVRKWRRKFRLMGCLGERATVLVSGTLLESLSLEHTDADVLMDTLSRFHLDRERNTSYVRAMKRVLGWSEKGLAREENRDADCEKRGTR